MPEDNKVDNSTTTRPIPPPSQPASSAQNDTQAKHQGRIITVLREIRQYLAKKLHALKDFFIKSDTHNLNRTTTKWHIPDSSTSAPGRGPSLQKKQKKQESPPVTAPVESIKVKKPAQEQKTIDKLAEREDLESHIKVLDSQISNTTRPSIENKKRSIFSRFFSFFGIHNAQTQKLTKVEKTPTSLPVLQRIEQAQSNTSGSLDIELPGYDKVKTLVNKEKNIHPNCIAYIFPRNQDGNTTVDGTEYGFSSDEEVVAFLNNQTLFIRLISITLDLKRNSYENIVNILGLDGCDMFIKSMRNFLNIFREQSEQDKEKLNKIMHEKSRKYCDKFFQDAIAEAEKAKKLHYEAMPKK